MSTVDPTEIAELEETLTKLFPTRRLEEPPSKELLDSASAWSQAIWKKGESLGALTLTQEKIEVGARLSKHPVFICGVHRSGTTLVRDMLDGHPALTVLPSEGSFLTSLESRMRQLPAKERRAFMGKEWLRRLANPINQPPYWLLGRSSSENSPYVLFVRQFLAWWDVANQGNKTFSPLLAVVLAYASVKGEITADYWVDKTPTNERFLKKIWKEMPEAKIIHVIRDPVAVLTSRKRMEPWLNLRTFLHDLKVSYRVAHEQSGRNDSRYLLIRYEELCDKPETITKLLAEFTKIDATQELLTPTVTGKPSSANSSFNKEPQAGHILTASEHKHNELLSDKEYELLAAYVGDLAGTLGYPMQHVRTWRVWFLRLKYWYRNSS
jgi:hypothetical protein